MQVSSEYILSKQLMRAGTSVGANVEEALQAQSRRDSVAKLSIAHKEASETRYWINLIVDSGYLDWRAADSASKVLSEVIGLLTAILKKMKQNGI